MARRRKPSGQQNRGPFSAEDVARALEAMGAVRETGGNHQTVYVHPVEGWKIPISDTWTSIRKGDPIYNGICRTTNRSTEQVIKFFNL